MFQFHQVQLIQKGIDPNLLVAMKFQFHQVQLILCLPSCKSEANLVSIPLGTINTRSLQRLSGYILVSIPLGTINTMLMQPLHDDYNVSIPLGTINTLARLWVWLLMCMFQFHQVQLILKTGSMDKAVELGFNSTRYN